MSEGAVHVGENAELYALGQLDDMETARLERHVRDCAQCAERVGEAESTVLQLIEDGAREDAAPVSTAWQPPRKSRYNPWLGAVAAAFVLGLLPWGVSLTRQPGSGENGPPGFAPQTAMLESHFLHAQFVPAAGGAPDAKVIYARNGGWFYVLVAGGSRPLDVVLLSSGKRSYVAVVPAVGQTRTAFVRAHGLFDAMELDDGGTPVATVKLIYPR